MTELNTNEIYKLAFNYDRKFHYQKIIKERLIGIMKQSDCGETIEQREKRKQDEQERQQQENELKQRERTRRQQQQENELKQRERTRTDLEEQLEKDFSTEQADIELESAIKRQEEERIREKHAIKKKNI